MFKDIDLLDTEEKLQLLSSFLLLLFPISFFVPFIKVFKKKLHYENTPGILVTTWYINSFMWYVYSNILEHDLMKYCYLVSGVICLFLMTVYLIYELKDYLVDAILNALIIITGSWALYKMLVEIIQEEQYIKQICASTYTLVILTSLVSLFRANIHKNRLYIPIVSSFALIPGCISWLLYTCVNQDKYILIPNILGLVFSLFEVYTYYSLKKKYGEVLEPPVEEPEQEQKKEENTAKISAQNDEELNEGLKEKKVEVKLSQKKE